MACGGDATGRPTRVIGRRLKLSVELLVYSNVILLGNLQEDGVKG